MTAVATLQRTVRHVPLTLTATLAALIAGVTFAGCSSPPEEGTLDGTLQAVSGPAGTVSRPISGSVTFHGSNGNIATIDLSHNGRFSAQLPLGRYTVAGHSPQFEGGVGGCQASGPVTVTKDVTIRVAVVCQER